MEPGDRQLNRHVDALKAYDEVLTIRSDQAGAWLGRADAYYRLKRFNETLAAYNKALAINRDLAEARHGLGVVNWCAATSRWSLSTEPWHSDRHPPRAVAGGRIPAKRFDNRGK